MWKAVIVLVVLVGLVAGEELLKAPLREERKQLAGPPSEFASMAIPDPALASLRADSVMVPFTLTRSSDVEEYSWSFSYPVDTAEEITVSVLSPFKNDLTFYLKSPSGSEFQKLDASMFDGPLSIGKRYHSDAFGIDGAVVPSYSYVFYVPETGVWDIKITSSKALVPPKPDLPQGYLLLDNESPYKLESHLNTYKLEVGEEIGLEVKMVTVNPNTFESMQTSSVVITDATMRVEMPDGKEFSVQMHDDGLKLDAQADDGIYTATIQASESGNYVFQPFIKGVTDQSKKFLRSVSHLVAVSEKKVQLTGAGFVSMDSKNGDVASIGIAVDILKQHVDETVRSYAEVWGTSAKDGKFVPIAWIESMVDPESHPTLGMVLRMDLNKDWIKQAGATTPFQLRNVAIQDRETNAVLSEKDIVVLKSDGSVEKTVLEPFYKLSNWASLSQSIEITEDMKYGPRPVKYQMLTSANVTAAAASGKLMLVHGYCSGDVWDHAHFTDSVKFEDYKASRSQDQFALRIKQFGESLGLPSFGIVGHSQGGLASMHLKSYYWSGLDTAKGERVIQSVGSPYKGCSLAGGLADLGGLFGVGCSSNSDLAPNGAQAWIAKVPKDAQDKVFYYTTTYDDSYFLAPACVTASGLVLHSPNDGTCEIKFSQPDKGGNNMGTTKKFCHTDGMNYPPQTRDTARNAIMNQKAAR